MAEKIVYSERFVVFRVSMDPPNSVPVGVFSSREDAERFTECAAEDWVRHENAKREDRFRSGESCGALVDLDDFGYDSSLEIEEVRLATGGGDL